MSGMLKVAISILSFLVLSCSETSFSGKNNQKASEKIPSAPSRQQPAIKHETIDIGSETDGNQQGPMSSAVDGNQIHPDNGLTGGHFDVDTSSAFYHPSAGKTDAHVHQYDDKFGVTHVDAMNLLGGKLRNIQSVIQNPAQKFILTLGNGHLSPGARIQINDTFTQSSGPLDTTKVWSFGGVDGSEKLTKLAILFEKDAITKGKLIATATGCVVANDPGAQGEYRNGALTLQAIDADNVHLQNGLATENAVLLWEITLFYHWEHGCY